MTKWLKILVDVLEIIIEEVEVINRSKQIDREEG